MSAGSQPVPGSPGANIPRRPCIDVAHLPESVLDHRSPVWVGNLILVLIETVVFGILVASLFYLRRNFEMWPPPLVNRQPAILEPLPGLLASTANVLLLLISIAPMLYTDRAALHMRERATKIGLVIMMVTIVFCIALRFMEFQELRFRWDANAYSAITWMILGMHLLHLFIALGESLIMTAWIFIKGLDKKHARDVRVTAVYWYWVVGTWVPLYLIIFIGPRL